MSLSERIKKIRKEKNISQETLSKTLGISRPTLSAIENGTKQASEKVIKKMAKAFNVSAEYLTQNDISNEKDFRGTNVLREYTYINTNRVVSLLQSTGQMLASEISTIIEKENKNSVGVDKVVVGKNEKTEVGSVRAKLTKTSLNYTNDLISYLEKNTLIESSLPTSVDQFNNRIFYSNELDLALSEFNESSAKLNQLMNLAYTFDTSTQSEEMKQVQTILNMIVGSNLYLISKSDDYTVLLKAKSDFFVVDMTEAFGNSTVIYKVARIVEKEAKYSLLSDQFNHLVGMMGEAKEIDNFYKAFEELEIKVGIKFNKKTMEISGPLVVIDPIVIYK